jgi:hypothetical protein
VALDSLSVGETTTATLARKALRCSSSADTFHDVERLLLSIFQPLTALLVGVIVTRIRSSPAGVAEKEVASMRRIIKVLAVATLMAVLMATYVSPAFAAQPNWALYGGYKVGQTGEPPEYTGANKCTWGNGGDKSGCD